MSRRRLAVVAPSRERGGAEEYLAMVARAAARAGWEVHAGLPRVPGTADFRRELSQGSLTVHALAIGDSHPPGKLGATRRIATDFLRTAAYLARVRPAVALVILPNPESAPGALLATTTLRIPALVVFQLVPPDLTVSIPRRRLYALARRRQRWVAVSDDNRRIVARAFGFDDERLIRIYNGVPIPDTPGPLERQEARAALGAELGLPREARLLLTVGRLSPQKGHDHVLDAFPAIRARAPDVVFLWAGAGELEGELRRRITEIGACDRIRLLGRRTDVRSLLAAADLFVFPSRYEGFGFALVEAMAARVPIVAGDQSATPEIVVDGSHGLLFRLGDQEHLAERIAWALAHPREMSAMAGRAATRVAERYREDEMLARTMHELAALGCRRPLT
jgi:glycosyltransferase involved in cell wall biosynthesis